MMWTYDLRWLLIIAPFKEKDKLFSQQHVFWPTLAPLCQQTAGQLPTFIPNLLKLNKSRNLRSIALRQFPAAIQLLAVVRRRRSERAARAHRVVAKRLPMLEKLRQNEVWNAYISCSQLSRSKFQQRSFQTCAGWNISQVSSRVLVSRVALDMQLLCNVPWNNCVKVYISI